MTARDPGGWLDRIPNLVLPTLGGRHFWADVELSPGYRLQRHVWTGHCRLLDLRDRRHAAGSLERCRQAAARLRPAVTTGGTLVVMLHGLYRSRRCFRSLERRLHDAGCTLVAPNYPSGHAGLAELGRWLNTLMAGFRGYREVVFVTYSLGGLVLRSALAAGDWRQRLPVAGIVQIGPPNRGARAADLIRRLPPDNRLSGPAARELCGPIDLPEPPDDIPVLVIAGGTGDDRGFNPLLDGDDDGLVRVAETRLDRPHEFCRLATLHGLLLGHPHTARLVRSAIARWTERGQADGCQADGSRAGGSQAGGRSLRAGGHSTTSRSSWPLPWWMKSLHSDAKVFHRTAGGTRFTPSLDTRTCRS